MKFVSLPIIGVTAAACALGASGCGSSLPTSNVVVAHPSTAPTLSGAELQRQLAAGVRDALSRMAVMQQPADGAADLGQDLPEGLVRSVRCVAPAASAGGGRAQTTTCAVGWKTAAGAPKRTDYTVRLTPGRCFVASADPALPPLHDATIQTYSEHPLNRITSLVRGC